MSESDFVYQYAVNDLSSVLVDNTDAESEENVPPPQPIITSTPKKKQNVQLHKCNQCNFQTPSAGNLCRHKRNKHLNIVYTCETCNGRFKSMYMLKQHVRSLHRGEKLMCELCSKSFNFRSALSKHKRAVHDNRFRFQCRFCEKKFVDKGHYQGHINTHVNSKPFKVSNP